MEYLLDTDICIFFLKGKFDIKNKIKDVGIENCYISEITIAELKYGAEKSKNFLKHSKEVDSMENLFTVVSIYTSLNLFAKEKVRLQKAGELIPDFDLLIGAAAVFNKMILVTNNGNHFQRMNEVKLENWTK